MKGQACWNLCLHCIVSNQFFCLQARCDIEGLWKPFSVQLIESRRVFQNKYFDNLNFLEGKTAQIFTTNLLLNSHRPLIILRFVWRISIEPSSKQKVIPQQVERRFQLLARLITCCFRRLQAFLVSLFTSANSRLLDENKY